MEQSDIYVFTAVNEDSMLKLSDSVEIRATERIGVRVVEQSTTIVENGTIMNKK